LKLFDGPVNVVPVQSLSSTFKLALCHVVPWDQLSSNIDPDTTKRFSIEYDISIEYDNSDLEEAIGATEARKHFREELGVVPAQSDKRNRSG
jgi:hypothetical protein